MTGSFVLIGIMMAAALFVRWAADRANMPYDSETEYDDLGPCS